MKLRFRPALSLSTLGLLASALAPGLVGSTLPAAAATAQSGTTTLSAPIIQPGTGVLDSARARLVGQVKFSPMVVRS